MRADMAGTALFVLATAIAVPLRAERWAQFLIAVVSVALFAVGVGSSLWAYAAALERSRVQEVGVANLYLLTGTTAPTTVKRVLLGALVVQVLASFGAATVGVVGLVVHGRSPKLVIISPPGGPTRPPPREAST